MHAKTYKLSALCAIFGLLLTGCLHDKALDANKHNPQSSTVVINAVSPEGVGEKIGTITLTDTAQGLRIQSSLGELPSGFHGFHIHEKGSCEPAEKDGKQVAALAAGGHFNPHNSGHGTPNDGHMGDLPVLNVDSNGNANTIALAPRLKLADVKGRAIMIHAGGDNYSDQPKPLGGGGDRIACGVI